MVEILTSCKIFSPGNTSIDLNSMYHFFVRLTHRNNKSGFRRVSRQQQVRFRNMLYEVFFLWLACVLLCIWQCAFLACIFANFFVIFFATFLLPFCQLFWACFLKCFFEWKSFLGQLATVKNYWLQWWTRVNWETRLYLRYLKAVMNKTSIPPLINSTFSRKNDGSKIYY